MHGFAFSKAFFVCCHAGDISFKDEEIRLDIIVLLL
jgi:hypothetical protein